MSAGIFLNLLRQFVLALYVLALVAPVAMQTGVQLDPTAVFLLDQDIARSRCSGSGGEEQVHHANGECCVQCTAPQLPGAASAENAVPLAFPVELIPAITPQTTGLKLGHAARPPIPRGPPA